MHYGIECTTRDWGACSQVGLIKKIFDEAILKALISCAQVKVCLQTTIISVIGGCGLLLVSKE